MLVCYPGVQHTLHKGRGHTQAQQHGGAGWADRGGQLASRVVSVRVLWGLFFVARAGCE